ncbi:MAG: hypothetical protein GY717_10070 [Rhodobacteraceae bacterium]|nr:hypothetical protein [Paracoccaceae bacterium]
MDTDAARRAMIDRDKDSDLPPCAQQRGGHIRAPHLVDAIGNLIPFRSREVKISWHGNIAFLCDNKRISNPPAMLHFTSEFTGI